MGRACLPVDISTPPHSGWAEEYHVPSKHMGQACLPVDISTPLQSRWAEEYHVPSKHMGRACLSGDIHPLSIVGWPEDYPLPSAGMGQGCLPGHIHAPNGTLKYPIHALWLNSMYDIFLPTLAILMLYIQNIAWAFPPNFSHIATCCQA